MSAWWLTVLWMLLGGSQSARAEALDTCVDRAVVEMQAVGATLAARSDVAFLLQGDRRSETYELRDAGCVGFLAFGRGRVLDLDLTLHTGSGIELERDIEEDARPYVRYCGAAGLRLVVEVEMYRGRGEYELLTFLNAPPTAPDLNRAVGRCFAQAGGIRRPPADVGPAPPPAPLSVMVTRQTRRLESLGWVSRGAAHRGKLTARQRGRAVLRFARGSCHAIVALGGPGVVSLDLTLLSQGDRVLGRDGGHRPTATVRTCAPDDGRVAADVRVREGSGEYVLLDYQLSDQGSTLPPGVRGEATIDYREMSARAAARGMRVRPVVWGYGAPAAALRVPVTVRAGRCYAFGAVRSTELRDGELDLILESAGGDLLARDLGIGDPLVYHCAPADGVDRLVARVSGARGRFLLLMATDP